MDVVRTVIVATLAVALLQVAQRTSYDAHGLRIAATAASDVARG